MPVGSYYGEPSGVVGLRLFPNPDFDEKARKAWDAERYYRDPTYYESPKLVRPYRIGMSCAFCHVGPNPVKPPANPERPAWADLSSNVGAQYFWWHRVFDWRGDSNGASFLNQALRTSLPGTLDTSLVSSDNINNPRTMNAVYLLGPRMGLAKRWGKEHLAGGELDNRQFNDYVPAGDPLAQFFEKPNTTWTPRVLKDGSDSVGALGALNRVYLNIGLFSEEWLLHFRALIGGQNITPIKIADAQRNSAYWQATELQTPYMARFFLASTAPHLLKDAPGGSSYLTEDAATVARGKEVFADTCARCHSSKLPPLPPRIDLENCNGAKYPGCWNDYWAWTKTPEFKQEMRKIAAAPDFLDDNFLSTELRVPSTLMQTNICSPIGTNAIAGNIWDNFSSQSYKQLPSVGNDEAAASAERRRVRLHPARRRARLHAAGIAREPVVYGAVPPEQLGGPVRGEPVGGGPDAGVPGVDRTDALAGTPGEGQAVPRSRDRGRGRRHHPAHTRRTATSACRGATSPPACGRCLRSRGAWPRRSSATARCSSGRSRKALPSAC